MATNDKLITKIYSIQVPGAKEAKVQVEAITKAFDKAREAKLALNRQMSQSIGSATNATIEALTQKIVALEKGMEKLSKQRVSAEKEANAQARAERDLAAAAVLTARAATEGARANTEAARASREVAQADSVRTRNLIAQDRELDRQIALEERNRAAMARTQQTVIAATGSYNALRQEYRELYRAVQAVPEGTGINFRGQQQGYDEAIANLQRLATAEQNFRRQFSQDGLLVGEYTTGIVNAFRNAGLDDLITGQIRRAEAEVERLNQEFEQTRQELTRLGVNGSGNLETLERSLIENRQQVAQLETQLRGVRTGMAGVGDVGNRVTDGLQRGFAGLRQNLSQLLLGYVGFQALISTTQSVFKDTIALDSQAAALAVVSGNTEELARNTAFLANITERLGVEVLPTTKAFKGFYAASVLAGIGADDTRTIFEAATVASSKLKLSQDDTNGVLLAFGQIASKGTVQAEELRGQIGERLPGAFSIAAKSIGVTQQELNKMLQGGKVIASEFLPKFAAELQRTFGGDSTEKVEGLQASLGRLKNQFTNIVADNQQGVSKLISGFIQGGSIILSIIGLITGNLPLVITLIGLYATGWALVNKELVIQKANLLLVNAQLIISRIGLGLAAIAQNAYTVSLGFFTGATTLATAAMRIFNLVVASNPIGLLLTVVAVAFAAVDAFGASVEGTTSDLKGMAKQMELNAEIQKEVTSTTTAQISKGQALIKVINDEKLALQDRRQALADLIALNPTYLQGLTLENIRTSEGIDLIKKYVVALQDKARAEALSGARAKALQSQIESQQNASRAQSDADFAKREYEKLNPSMTGIKSIGTAIRYGTLDGEQASVAAYYEKEAKAQAEAIRVYDAITTAQLQQSATNLRNSEGRWHEVTVSERKTELEAGLKAKKAGYDKLNLADAAGQQRNRDEQKAIQKQLDTLEGKEEKEKKGGSGSKISGVVKDAQKDADAARDTALTNEKLRYEELKKVRALDVADEVEHLETLNRIQQDSITKKLSTLRGSNASERKLQADLKLQRITGIAETAQKVYELREKDAKEQLEAAKKNAEEILKAITDSDTATPVDKAAGQVANLKALQQANADYYRAIANAAGENKQAIALIEKEKADTTKQTEAELNLSIRRLRNELYNQEVQQIRDQSTLRATLIDGVARTEALRVLKNASLTSEQKTKRLKQLELESQRDILSAQIQANDREIEAMRRKYGLLTALSKEYYALLKDNADKALQKQQVNDELDATQTGRKWKFKEEGLQSYLKESLGLGEQELLVLSKGGEYAQQFLQQELAGDAALIESKRNKATQRDATEKAERLKFAESTAEKEAIEREYEERKKAVELNAARERRNLAIKQLNIEAALGIAKTLASLPFPANVILASGQAILFDIQRSNLQAQQFEDGGRLQRRGVPTQGGEFGGKRHSAGGTPFGFGGGQYEAEVGELAIINRRAAASSRVMTVTGTPRQIASAINEEGGGVRFASGAQSRRFEYGGALQAPSFVLSGRSGGSAVGEDLSGVFRVMEMQSAAIAATAGRIDTLQVIQDTGTVTAAQEKQVKQTNRATL